MTTVYLVRHGTTDANIQGRFQGRSDIALNEMGRRQGEYLAERFARVSLDAVYTSPLTRARETAAYLCRGRNLTPVPRDGLMEIDGGAMEGRLEQDNFREYPDETAALMGNIWQFQAPGGESTLEVYHRMIDAIAAIVSENPGGAVAVVSHGFAMTTYINYLKGTPPHLFKRYAHTNMAVTTITYEGSAHPVPVSVADDTHLPPELRYLYPRG